MNSVTDEHVSWYVCVCVRLHPFMCMCVTLVFVILHFVCTCVRVLHLRASLCAMCARVFPLFSLTGWT